MQAGAILKLQKDGKNLPAATFSPVIIQGVRWFKVVTGAFATAAGADSLLTRLRQQKLLRDGSVVRLPFAFRIDSGVPAKAVPAMVAAYGDRGQPVYALQQADGTAWLLVGAFESPRAGLVVPRITSIRHSTRARVSQREIVLVRLTKLELQGFKSFADSTEMVFNAGVTAIVGPNGCGKSNVSDAVRWVLGEQRARLLRGAKMEEVIFQGSSARRAVNVAEVSLHFSNEDGTLPVAFQEVVITRRLSRSGESEYFLNRAPCRLRDISDLLRGTGLGADTGVVIESKMIDALLSDRPDDRRELFEEAAGVGLYRDRRRTTERRLEETTVDLQRLDDLITEVQSQVRSLARQRKRAERHSELTARRFTIEIALAKREMEAWHDELQRLGERVSELREAAPRSEEAVRAAEQARDALARHARRRGGAAHGAAAPRVDAARAGPADPQRDGGRRRAAAQRARAPPARRARGQLKAKRTAVASRPIAIRRRPSERSSRQQLVAARADARSSASGEEDATRQNVAAMRMAVEDAERQHRELQDRARRVEIDRERARRESDELLAARRTVDARAAAARRRAERDRARARVSGRRRRRRSAQARAGQPPRRSRPRAPPIARRATVRRSARAELFRADEAHTSLQGKVNALDALERERVGLAPAAARLLREREQFGDGAVLGPVERFHQRRSSVRTPRRALPRRDGARGAGARSRGRRSGSRVARDGEPRTAPSAPARRAARGDSENEGAMRSRTRVDAAGPGTSLGSRAARARARRGRLARPSSTRAARCGSPAVSRAPDRCVAAPSSLRCAPSSRRPNRRARRAGRGRRASRRGAGIGAPRARGVRVARSGAGRRATRSGAAGRAPAPPPARRARSAGGRRAHRSSVTTRRDRTRRAARPARRRGGRTIAEALAVRAESADARTRSS